MRDRCTSLTGPTLLAPRPFKDVNEKMDVTMVALDGLSLNARPDLWQPYAVAKSDIWQAAKTGRKPETRAYLPMVVRKSF